MKAKAPEKVYLHLTKGNYRLNGEYYEHKPAKIRFGDKIIEYTRTDAFIEKACAWLEEKCDLANYEAFNPDNRTYYIDHDKMIDDFKKYMKGE